MDDLKKGIFMIVNVKPLINLRDAKKKVNQLYVEYFKNRLGINISRENFTKRYDLVNKEEKEKNPFHIIVHGIDFMTQAQVQGKFRAINPTIVTYINASNVSIKFDERENVQNFLNL